MTPRHLQSGLTVVELLIAAALLGVVFALIANFFVQQSQVTRQTQARNEIEVNMRTVAEIIAQDLQVAGSSVVFNGGIASDIQIGCSANSGTKCIRSPSGGGGNQDDLSITYATSLRANACRRIAYTFFGNNLRRSDVACTVTGDDPQAFADNVLTLNISYQCADNRITPDPAVCYDGPGGVQSFPRQATINVAGRSTAFADVVADVTLTTSIPNARF